jgi:hypothetical protein
MKPEPPSEDGQSSSQAGLWFAGKWWHGLQSVLAPAEGGATTEAREKFSCSRQEMDKLQSTDFQTI